jgi:hypothetical protein
MYLWDAQPRGTFDVVLFKERKGIGALCHPPRPRIWIYRLILRLLGDGEEADGELPSPARDE